MGAVYNFFADICAAGRVSLLGAYNIAIVLKIKKIVKYQASEEQRENFSHK
jgi:hypothetical protein